MGPLKNIMLFLALSLHATGQGTTPPAPTIPAFSFLTANGRTITNADLPPNTAVLIVFVDVDCEHCQKAVRHMNDSVALFSKLPLYMVSVADQPKLRAFARQYGPRLKAHWLRDPDARNMIRFRPVRYPAMFLYSPEKRLLDYEDNVEAIFRIERNIRALHRL